MIRLQKAKDKCKQKRMDSFFTVKKTASVKRSGSAVADKKKAKKYGCLLTNKTIHFQNNSLTRNSSTSSFSLFSLQEPSLAFHRFPSYRSCPLTSRT